MKDVRKEIAESETKEYGKFGRKLHEDEIAEMVEKIITANQKFDTALDTPVLTDPDEQIVVDEELELYDLIRQRLSKRIGRSAYKHYGLDKMLDIPFDALLTQLADL